VRWDPGFLYVAAAVRDDERRPKTNNRKWGGPWSHDGLVVQVNSPRWLADSCRGQDAVPASVSFGLNHYSKNATARELSHDSRYVVVDTDDGYRLEAAISFQALGWTPARDGDRFGFALILVDHNPGQYDLRLRLE